MKFLIILVALVIAFNAAAKERKLPIASGEYIFRHKFAERPNMQSILLTAKITRRHIVLINETQSDVFPKGIIVDGTLMWHAQSRQWIIGIDRSDRHAKDVGGCSDGPEVIDLKQRIYWTC